MDEWENIYSRLFIIDPAKNKAFGSSNANPSNFFTDTVEGYSQLITPEGKVKPVDLLPFGLLFLVIIIINNVMTILHTNG